MQQVSGNITGMFLSRREFLAAAGAGLSRIVPPAANPSLGLIFPPENYPIPPDAKLLFPTGVDFIGNGVGLPGGMTVDGYDEAIPRVLPKAVELAQQGANVVSVFGSSLTFYKGAKSTTTSSGRSKGRPAAARRHRVMASLMVCAR